MALNIVELLFDQQIGGVKLSLDYKKHRRQRLARLLLTSRRFHLIPKPAVDETLKRRKDLEKEGQHLKHSFAYSRSSISYVNGRMIIDETRRCILLHRPDKYSCTFEKPIFNRPGAVVSFKNAMHVPSRFKLAISSIECTCNHECSFFTTDACQLHSKSSESILVLKENDLILFDSFTGQIKKRLSLRKEDRFGYRSSYYDEFEDTLTLHLVHREVHNFVVFSCNPFHELKTLRISFLGRGSCNLLSNYIICHSATGANANLFDLDSELHDDCSAKQQVVYLETPLSALTKVNPSDVLIGGHSKLVVIFTPKTEKKHFHLSYLHNFEDSLELPREERTIFDECGFIEKPVSSRIFYLGNHSIDVFKLNYTDELIPKADLLFTVATEERVEPEPRKFESNRPKRVNSFQGSYFCIVRSIFAFDYSEEFDLITIFGLSRETQLPHIQIFDGSNGQLLNTIRVQMGSTKYFVFKIVFSQLTIALIGTNPSSYAFLYLYDLATDALSDGKVNGKKSRKNNAATAVNKKTKENSKVKKKPSKKKQPKEKTVSAKSIKFVQFGRSTQSEDDNSSDDPDFGSGDETEIEER